MARRRSFLAAIPAGVLAAMILYSSASLRAQIGTASLSGRVTDPSGAAVPNATVTLSAVDRTFTRSTVTDGAGEYVLPALQPGQYRVKLTASGFATYATEPFSLSSGEGRALNLTLHLATQQSRVTVQASAPLLQTTSASIGSTVSSTQFADLPILGRSFLNLISLEPGTVPIAPTGSTTNHNPTGQSVMPSVFGQRQKDNNFLMDGVENRDPNLLGVALYPPPDAIAEMKIDSGVGSAVYGHASGATIDIVTKSGTNQWHGDGWEYLRNNAFDARSFFTPTIGGFHWNQFGGDIGGPLMIPHLLSKRKAWYVFGYYEGVRIHNAANFETRVPTAAEMQGDFTGLAPIYDPYTTVPGPNNKFVRTQFPNNMIPQREMNATSVKLAHIIFPAPNLTGITGVNYINTAGNVNDGNQWDARVDHEFGQHDNFFTRYSAANNPSSGVSLPSLYGTQTDRLQNIEVSDTHIFSPSFILTGRYGFIGQYYFTGNQYPAGASAQTGLNAVFPEWEGYATLPQVSIQSYQGVSSNFALVGPIRQQTGMGDAHAIKGNHNIDFGVSLVHSFLNLDQYQSNVTFSSAQTGNNISRTGDGFASFLLGTPSSASRQIGGARGIMVSNAEGAYVQDNWHHRALTVNTGLRYDYNSPPVDRLGLGTFDFDTGVYRWSQTNPITGAAPNMSPGGIPPDHRDFAPRLGIAYSITPRLVVRASGGIFYDSFGSNYVQASQSERGNWPFNFPQNLSGLNATTVTTVWPNPFPGNPAGSKTPTICSQCLNVDKSSSRTPYVGEWTFSLQYQFNPNLMAEADYFGSKGTKLTSQIIDNTAVEPGPIPFSSRQIYPQYAPYILNGYNEYGSWYDGAAFRLQQRFSHGLTYLISYTYSKNIDYVDNLSNSVAGATSNPTRFNARLNRGLAGFDIRNVLVASGIWQIPGRTNNRVLDAVISGWRFGNILTLHSGLPFSVIVFGDYANIGSVGGRYPEYASLVGNPNSIGIRTPQAWFNTAAFAVPPNGVYGTAGRDIVHTDGLIDDDVALSKEWKVRERTSIELRGEFFNIFNNVNFGYPDPFVDDGAPQFGSISSTLNPGRQIQLALKIHF